MKTQKWKLSLDTGWYTGNPFIGFKISFFETVPDYPYGWTMVELFSVTIGHFVFSVLLTKVSRW